MVLSFRHKKSIGLSTLLFSNKYSSVARLKMIFVLVAVTMLTVSLDVIVEMFLSKVRLVFASLFNNIMNYGILFNSINLKICDDW